MASSMLKLMSTVDKEVIEVEEAVAMESQLIRQMTEVGAGALLPLALPSCTLRKVVQFCRTLQARHRNSGAAEEPEAVQPHTADFFSALSHSTILELMKAADYLLIAKLFDACAATIAKWMEGKSPEKMRQVFGLPQDLSLKEVKAMKRQHKWIP